MTVLVDRSGSMTSIKDAMEEAFSGFLKEHRKVPSTRLTLIQFDDQNDQDLVYVDQPIRSAEKLYLNPRGSTPLLDAMCKTIDMTGERLSRLNERFRPDQVLMVIITDGAENSSTTYKRKDVFDRITRQRNQYKWQFVYLGANQDAIAEATSFGISRGQTMTYLPTAGSVGTMSNSLIGTTTCYVNSTTRSSNLANFTEAERQAVANGVVVPQPGTTTSRA